jgi:hypothetical protein
VPHTTNPRGRIHSIIGDYLQQRADTVCGKGEHNPDPLRQFDFATHEFSRRFHTESLLLRAEYERVRTLPFGGYCDATVTITVDDIDSRGDGVALAKVTEQTKLRFAEVPETATDAGPAPVRFEQYRLTHEFELRRESCAWQIHRATPLLTGGPPPAPHADKPFIRHPGGIIPAVPLVDPAPCCARPTTLSMQRDKETGERLVSRSLPSAYGLDWPAMLAYAQEWWDKRNPNFNEFPSDGTNFLSQIMLAGGLPMIGAYPQRTDNGVWFHGWAVDTCSYTWGDAQHNAVFLLNFSGHAEDLVAKHRGWEGVMRAQPADVVYANWAHSPSDADVLDQSFFVTGRLTPANDPTNPVAADLFLTSHMNDRHNFPLSTVLSRPDADPQDRYAALHTF